MSTIVADPSVLTKDRLKSDLQSHNIPLPSGDARKDAYVKLYLKHLTPLIAKKHRDSPKRSEFSSDEESTPRVRGERKKTTKKSSSSRVISRDDIEIEKDVANLSDTELASALQELGATIGPITATTRSVYERKLIKLRSGQTQIEQDEESDDYSDSDEDVPVQKSSQESDEAERTQTRKRVVKATTYTERVSQQEKRDSPAKKNVTQKKESYQEEKTTVVKTAVKEINKQTTTTAEKKKGFVPVFVQIGVLLLVAVMIFLVLYNMESVPQKRLPQVPNKGN